MKQSNVHCRWSKRVLHSIVVAGVGSCLLLAAPAWAADPVAELRERLIRIEQEKDREIAELKQRLSELEQAKAHETEQLKERVTAVEAKTKDSEKQGESWAALSKKMSWLDRVTFFGDIRVRHEGFYQDSGPDANARQRERIRFRFGAKVKISDELEGGFRLVSGGEDSPTSLDQTLDNFLTRKPLSIDWAYITFTPLKTLGLEKPLLSITGGKFGAPVFVPTAAMQSELVFNSELSIEGLHEKVTLFSAKDGLLRNIALNAEQWVIKEAARSADSWMLGGQVVADFVPSASTKLSLAAANYNFSKVDLLARGRNTNSDLLMTNGLILKDGTVVKGGFPFRPNADNPIRDMRHDFNIVNLSAQFTLDTGLPKWPVHLIADFAHNTEAPTDNTALWLGASIGALKEPGDWTFSGAWARTETDSVLSAFSYSDFGRFGGTNVEGGWLQAEYRLMDALTLSAKHHFVSFIDRPAGQSNSLVHRMQLNAMLAF